MLYGLPLAVLYVATPFPTAADALAPHLGLPVLSVDLDAPVEEDAESLRALIDIEPGFLVSSDAIEAAVKRLYALGRFSDVGVTAERFSGTVALHFYLRPIRRLESLTIEGLKDADEGRLRRALGLQAGDEIDRRIEQRLTDRTLAYLKRTGFPQATVTTELNESSEPMLVSARVRVDEGTPERVGEVRFLGHPRLAATELARLVGTKVGGILDTEQLANDVAILKREFRKRGFMEVEVDDPQVTLQGQLARVDYPMHAHDRLQIEIHGNRALRKGVLLRLFPETGAGVTTADLQLFADRITEAYRNLGYFEATTLWHQTTDAAHERRLATFQIREGKLFWVEGITFPGARALQPVLLRAQIEAVLRQSLRDDSLVESLTTADTCLIAALAEGNLNGHPSTCTPQEVPIERRWIPALYETALDEIRAAYQNLGFLDAVVGPAEASLDHQLVRVRIPVDEGVQSFIAAIAFRGNEAFPASELLDLIGTRESEDRTVLPVRPGAAFSAAAIEEARIAILRHYREVGFLYAQVATTLEPTQQPERRNVSFVVEEGPQVHIGRIIVRGNRYTRDGVIRSRLGLEPHSVYRLDQALKDQRAIASLGIFTNVRVRLIDEEKPDETKDLVAEVVERNRQPIELSAGLSSADGPRVGASYSHLNLLGTAAAFNSSVRANRKIFFALYGRYAEIMRARYQAFAPLDEIEREVRAGVRTPPILALPFDPTIRLDVVNERENAIPYSLNSNSVILGFDFSAGSVLSLSIEPQLSRTNLECIDIAGDATNECNLEAQTRRIDQGRRDTFKVGPTISLDLRDDPFNPHRGAFASANATYADGLLNNNQGRFTFAHLEALVNLYLPLGSNTFAVSLRAGRNFRMQGSVPVNERFFLGGRSTLRGFVDPGTLIPEDACVSTTLTPVSSKCAETIVKPDSEPPVTKGGDFMLLVRNELRVPMTDNMALGLFVDAGNLWVNTPQVNALRLRVGTGAGLRYNTPVGPLALDVGVNTKPRPENGEPSKPQLHFTVGVF